MSQLTTLPGFREFYPEDCSLRNYLFAKMRETCVEFGFEEYDAPILEPIELFTTKSGEEIVTQLFNFKDKGDRHIALRPEMTPSLARMIGAKASSMKRPIKWFNISESFRYERPQKGRLRSFYQTNVDIFGDNTFAADAEIIAFGISVFQKLGLTSKDFHIRLSDRILWSMFITSIGIDDTKIHDMLCIIDKIERESKEKIIENIAKISSNAEVIYNNINQLKNIKSINDLSNLFKNPTEEVLTRINEMQQLLDQLQMFGFSEFITLDFSIVRGLAYYTGFVFEFFERTGDSRALAGGGRYDNLIKKLGYNDLCAVGFAIGDVTLGNLLKEKNLVPDFNKAIDCFIIYTENTKKAALHDLQQLRSNGISTDYVFNPSTIAKQLKSADTNNAKLAVIFGEDEIVNNSVRVKNLQTRTEELIDLNNLVNHIKSIFNK